jgi:hypothetical protein
MPPSQSPNQGLNGLQIFIKRRVLTVIHIMSLGQKWIMKYRTFTFRSFLGLWFLSKIMGGIINYCTGGWIIMAKVCCTFFKKLDLDNIIQLPSAS